MYKRNDHKTRPKWTVRIKVPNTKGYVVKSTRTADFDEGRRFSEDLYYELEGKVRRGEVIKAPPLRGLPRSEYGTVSNSSETVAIPIGLAWYVWSR